MKKANEIIKITLFISCVKRKVSKLVFTLLHVRWRRYVIGIHVERKKRKLRNNSRMKNMGKNQYVVKLAKNPFNIITKKLHEPKKSYFVSTFSYTI